MCDYWISFLLTLWPSAKVKATESGIQWQRLMLPVSMSDMEEVGRTIRSSNVPCTSGYHRGGTGKRKQARPSGRLSTCPTSWRRTNDPTDPYQGSPFIALLRPIRTTSRKEHIIKHFAWGPPPRDAFKLNEVVLGRIRYRRRPRAFCIQSIWWSSAILCRSGKLRECLLLKLKWNLVKTALEM